MKFSQAPVAVSGIVKAETDKAVLINAGTAQEWVPKSQIQNVSEIDFIKDESVDIEIPAWLAREKGFL